jgi:hypothetical protein
MKELNYFKIESFVKVRLLNHQWKGDEKDIQKIRSENIAHDRFINHGLPISIEEIDLFIEWAELGKTQKELEDFFQRRIFNLFDKIEDFKKKKILNQNPKVVYFNKPGFSQNNLNIKPPVGDKSIQKTNGIILPRLERGYLVKNPKNEEWGEGVILSVDNKSRRDNARIQILFPKVGFKEFQMDSFNLEGVYTNTALSDLEINKWILKSKGVNSFWHITHMTNINNIHLHGVMSNFEVNRFEGLIYEDISSQGVQAWRERPDKIYGINIHAYVPLYINPKNAMLYRVQKEHKDDICLVEISLDVLGSRYLFTDGNAASRYSNFYSDVASEYQNIPWNDVFKESWFEEDVYYNQIIKTKNNVIKSHMQSEFLIYPKIENEFIKKIHCQNQGTVDFVQGKLELHLDDPFYYPSRELFQVESDPSAFFKIN